MRPNLRRMTFPMVARLHPDQILAIMEANGFVFLQRACPVKLQEPNLVDVDEVRQCVTYFQWDDVNETADEAG
jgi:hypothetical protein